MSSRYIDNGTNGFDQRILVTHDSGGRELVWDYYSDLDGDTWKGGWVRTSTWDCDWRE